MGTFSTALAILCLLLCSGIFKGISTEESDNKLPTDEIEKGVTSSKDLLEGLDNLAKWVAESKKTTEVIEKVLKVFDGFGKIASSFGFLGALIGFILALIPQSDPTFNFMKEQFAEVNRKLDSMSFQISTLQTEMEWTNYASAYGKDENAIKNSWTKMRELMEKGPIATTAEQKSRLAEQFTSFYVTTGTESSVANLYRYLTERNPASLNRNLLQLVTEKSNGNFKVLTQYSSYFTALMVSGLQMNIVFYKLKGYDAESKAKESATQLSDTLLAIQDALIGCANGFEKWAAEDVQRLGTERFSENKDLAQKIKKHLDEKFIWYDWTVIAHSNEAEEEYTFGNSISLTVQDKTRLHVIHRQTKTTIDQTIVDNLNSKLTQNTRGVAAYAFWKDRILTEIGTAAVNNIQFLHVVRPPSDYTQTGDSDVEIKCNIQFCGKPGDPNLRIYRDERALNVFLKSKEVVQEAPCSKMNCHNGECKPIKDTTLGFCRCHPMYRGSTCEDSIQSEIDYASTESKINDIILHPVPDLPAIYHNIKELKEYTRELVKSLQLDIQWTQLLVKYDDVIKTFRYIAWAHKQFQDNSIRRDRFTSEVGQQFSGGKTFLSQLTNYNDMMMGTGFGETQNILDVFRSSFNSEEACTETYISKVENFVRIMFTLEKEAMLAWQKYLLSNGNSKEIKEMENIFQKFVSSQWKLLNKNGCGPLSAENLDNKHCQKAYHSTDQQQVTLKCSGAYRPYPASVQCSRGKWSSLPMCTSVGPKHQINCFNRDGVTFCEATCTRGWSNGDSKPQISVCIQQPCPSFTPKECNQCKEHTVCEDNELCDLQSGMCRHGCLVNGCGVNAKCSYKNHQKTCTCISPWTGDPNTGCKSQKLKWVIYNTGEQLPVGFVATKSGWPICRVFGQDEDKHPGHAVHMNGRYVCLYEWDWNSYTSPSFEILVDPCEGRGYHWMDGWQSNGFESSTSKKRWPGLPFYVCSVKKNNYGGKLFNTKEGYMCHIGLKGESRRPDFYTLVPKQCF